MKRARRIVGTLALAFAVSAGWGALSASPAAAHARCDGQAHRHFHYDHPLGWDQWSSSTRVWHHVPGFPDHWDAYATNLTHPHQSDRKHCYW